MMAARAASAPIFFGRNHPKYREVHIRDMIDRVQYPPEVLQYAHMTESFSASGRVNAGQGADFIHEETNKLVKSFLPPGGIGSTTWTRVCRRANELKRSKTQ